MNIVELIRKKREGHSLTEDEFRFLLSGYVEGRIPDYQMSAFLMACYFQGMSEQETLTFTTLMLHSGEVVDLTPIPGIKVDKHSTGGVGDKVSLILAPNARPFRAERGKWEVARGRFGRGDWGAWRRAWVICDANFAVLSDFPAREVK